ncbi:MAG: hypothetical protein WCI55_08285 [Armatimonadota bacterium]
MLWSATVGCFIGVIVASKYDMKIPKRNSPIVFRTRPSVVLPNDAEIAESIVGKYNARVGMFYTPMKMEIFSNGTYLCGKTKGHWTKRSPRMIELKENQGGWVHVLSCQGLGSWSSGADGIQLGRKVNRSFMPK